jgi:hypothetical protein
MGNAIMTFYAALIDLLGRCAPEMHVSALGAAVAIYLSVFTELGSVHPGDFMLHYE